MNLHSILYATALRPCGAIRRSLSLLLPLALALSSGGVFGQSAPASLRSSEEAIPQETPTITTARHYWKASQSEELRDREHRLDLNFTVLFYDPDWRLLYMQAGGAGDYLPTMGPGFAFKYGDLVRLSGTIRPAQPLPSDSLTVEVLRSGHLPQPLPLYDHWDRYADFHNGYVALEGYVDKASWIDDRHARYDLICGGRRVELTVLVNPHEPIPVLENSLIRASGTFSVNPSQGGRPETLSLWSDSRADVAVLADQTASLFGLEPTPIGRLAEAAEGELVKIEAYVFAQEPGRSLILVNQDGRVSLSTPQTSPLHPDDFLEVIGTPARDGLEWTLKDPIYRLKPNSILQNDPSSPGASNRKYVLAQQVRRASPEELAKGERAALSGVVTYYDPAGRFLYLQDASAGIEVKIDAPLFRAPVPGEGVIVTGRVAQGAFSPCILADTVELKGSLSIPVPISLSYEQALSGHYDGQWVSVSGYVERVTPSGDSTLARLSTNSGQYEIVVANGEGPLDIELGALAQIRGVLSIKADGERKLQSPELQVPSKQFAQPSPDSQEDAFSLPLSTIASLEQFRPPEAASSKVRIRGVVSYHDPGEILYLSNGDDTARVLTRSQAQLEPGTEVDVVGLVQREGRRVYVANPVFQTLGRGAQPAPIVLDRAAATLDPALDGRSVSFEGRLIEIERSAYSSKTRLIIQNGSMIVEANGDFGHGQKELLKGSLIAATGIYDLQLDRYGEPDHLRILMRGPDDLAVLSRPPWLTSGNLLAIAGIACAALLAAGLWTFLLRHRIKSQTLQIKEQLEREALIENRHREIIGNVSDFIFTVDARGRILSCNKAGERITGYAAEELEGMSVLDLFDAEAPGAAREALANMNLAQLGVVETRARRKDGSLLWVELGAGLVHADDDATYGYGVMRDVDSRKRTELELKRARDAAEATTKAKDTFLATMSHELRTPMNGVIGMTELLLTRDLDPETRQYAQTIRDSADSLLVLLNDILDLSKAQAGKLTIDPHPFNLVDCINQPITLLQANAKAKGLELKLVRPAALRGPVVGDAGRLRQVLLNLVGNAIKFTERGSVVLTLSVLEETETDLRLKFAVTDTGIGIARHVQPRLFEAFEQADASLSRKFGGTGLGLNISRSIVSLMGGEIGLVSAEGEGSTFWFSLRLPKAGEKNGAPAARSPEAPERRLKWTGAAIATLVVEDNPVNQKVTRLQLQKMGLQADFANDGFEALAAIKKRAYDVIFMDCQMPGLDGLDATREIRRNRDNDGIYIVALTASAMQGDRENCLAAGMDDYVTKPTRPDKLHGALERFAERNGSAVPSGVD